MMFDTTHQLVLDFSTDMSKATSAEITIEVPEPSEMTVADVQGWERDRLECFRSYSLEKRPLLPEPEGGFLSITAEDLVAA